MTTTIIYKGLAAIISHTGAELVSLRNREREFIWEGDPDYWGKHSPVLFPIVGTLKNNQYHYNNQEYSLSRHGFARDMEFSLIERSENSATFSVADSEDTLKAYPFRFEFYIIYTLHENRLEIAYKVFNKGIGQMLFSVGAHPAFALPLAFEDYSIEIEKKELLRYHLLEDGLISSKTGTISTNTNRFCLSYPLFEKDALIFKNLESRSLTILEAGKPLLKVIFDGFPYLGIWTKIKAPFICIEPWFGHSDTIGTDGDLSKKEGILALQPNAAFNCDFSINIL